MLTKSQASQVGDELVEGAKASREELWNARARRVPFYYQVHGLSALPRWKQSQLLGAARRTASFTWPALTMLIGWLCCCALIWYLLGQPTKTPGFIPVGAVALAGSFGLRVGFMRRKLRLLLQQEQGLVHP
jgi:hypothetical protein